MSSHRRARPPFMHMAGGHRGSKIHKNQLVKFNSLNHKVSKDKRNRMGNNDLPTHLDVGLNFLEFHEEIYVKKISMPKVEQHCFKGNRTIADLRYGDKDIISPSKLILVPLRANLVYILSISPLLYSIS